MGLTLHALQTSAVTPLRDGKFNGHRRCATVTHVFSVHWYASCGGKRAHLVALPLSRQQE